MVQQDEKTGQSGAEIDLSGNTGDIPEEQLAEVTLPQLLSLFPNSEAKTFTTPKAPNCIYFVLDVVPVKVAMADKDRIMNCLKFDLRNLSISRTQYCFRLEDELCECKLSELSDMIEKMGDELSKKLKEQPHSEELLTTVNQLKSLGFDKSESK